MGSLFGGSSSSASPPPPPPLPPAAIPPSLASAGVQAAGANQTAKAAALAGATQKTPGMGSIGAPPTAGQSLGPA